MSINDINTQSITMLEKLELASVRKCLPKRWKELSNSLHDIESFEKQQQMNINKLKTKRVYKTMVQYIIIPPSLEHIF